MTAISTIERQSLVARKTPMGCGTLEGIQYAGRATKPNDIAAYVITAKTIGDENERHRERRR